MSLVSMLFDGFQLDPLFYKCPLNKPVGVPRPYWGLYFLISGGITLLLYIPCIIAIASHDHMKTAAYKTMLVLGFYDISSTLIHSIATGFLGYYGITFCDYPRTIFALGALGLTSWMGCCISSMTLAVIRICDINPPPQLRVRTLFEGDKIFLWLVLFLAYGFYAGCFTKPVIFTPTYMSWFFDPMLGGNPDNFINLAHTGNNILMAICTTLFYSYLCYIVLTGSQLPETESRKLSGIQITIISQTFLFCIFHTIGAVLYAYMQFFSAPEYLILMGQITWQLTSVSVCLVYLTLNRTIRRSVTRMVLPKCLCKGSQVDVVQRMSISQTGL